MYDVRKKEYTCRVCRETIKEGDTPWYEVSLTGDLQRWHKECDSKRVRPKNKRYCKQ